MLWESRRRRDAEPRGDALRRIGGGSLADERAVGGGGAGDADVVANADGTGITDDGLPGSAGGEVLVPGEPELRMRAERGKNGLPLPDPGVAIRHAELGLGESGGLFLTDLGKTFVAADINARKELSKDPVGRAMYQLEEAVLVESQASDDPTALRSALSGYQAALAIMPDTVPPELEAMLRAQVAVPVDDQPGRDPLGQRLERRPGVATRQAHERGDVERPGDTVGRQLADAVASDRCGT